MNHHDSSGLLNRRHFLARGISGLGAGALAGLGMSRDRLGLAAQPPVRIGHSHMKLSLAAYSFNRVLPRRGAKKRSPSATYSLEQFIDFCAEQDLDGAELTAYYFPEEITADYLNSLKERTFRLGLDISGTAIGNNFCLPPGEARDQSLKMCRDWIDYAAILGAPVIRIFAGEVPKGESDDVAIERSIAGINQSLEYAATKGVFLALENHGGITSTTDQMLRIVQGVKSSPWFGVNFDGGNFATSDPYADLEKIAPYAINAQIKTEMSPNGRKEPADLARVVKILKDAHYCGYLVLEYEAEEDPFVAVPRYLRELRELI